MKVKKKEYIELTIGGKYTIDYNKKFVHVGDLVYIEDPEDGYYDIFIVAQVGYGEVKLVSIITGNRWREEAVKYDQNVSIHLEDLVRSKHYKYFALKEVKE